MSFRPTSSHNELQTMTYKEDEIVERTEQQHKLYVYFGKNKLEPLQ